MTRNIWVLIFFIATSVPPAAQGQQVNRGLVSPQVNADHMVTFRFLAPEAEEVRLHTQFEQSPVAMTRDSSGVWSATLGPVEPDIYPYFFVVDGVQVADPLNQDIFPNEGFKSSLVEVPGSSPQVHTIRDVPHGTLSYRYYQSDELGTRPVVVYTPPGYRENEGTNYPVLYLLHGTTDTEETWSKVGRAHIILDNLIHQAEAVPMIIVMPYGRAYPVIGKSSGSLRNWDNLQAFKKDFLDNLMPFVEANYRVIKDRDGRAIAGFSGGGGEALYLGLNNQDLFGWVAGFAPGMRSDEFDRNNAGAFADPAQTNRNLNLFWIGVGREDFTYGVVKEYLVLLDEKGIRHESFISDGGHTWMNCRLYLSIIASRLFN